MFVRVAPHISDPLMRCGCAQHCAALRGVLLPSGARVWLGGGDGDGGQVARWWTGMSLSPLTSGLARRQWRRGALVDGEIACESKDSQAQIVNLKTVGEFPEKQIARSL